LALNTPSEEVKVMPGQLAAIAEQAAIGGVGGGVDSRLPRPRKPRRHAMIGYRDRKAAVSWKGKERLSVAVALISETRKESLERNRTTKAKTLDYH
jgi:hypothetical protein